MSTKWSAFSSGSAIGDSDTTVGLQSGANVKWAWSAVKTYLLGTATSALSIAAGKTLTASNSVTLAGGDASTLAIAAAKTLTVSNSLTLTGTDSTSFAFPSSSGSVAVLGAQSFTGQQTFAAGTTAIAPEVLQSGTNLTSATAGATEYDGAQRYFTVDTVGGRGAIPVQQYFHLTASGGNISTIANFFGANSNINLVASGYYEIDIYCFFTNTTAGTVTWTLTNSTAPTSQNIIFEMCPITGVVAPPGTATMLSGQIVGDTTAAKSFTTGTLSDATSQYARFKIFLKNSAGAPGNTTLLIQATKNVGGTITPLTGSWWFARRLSPNNIGTFAA